MKPIVYLITLMAFCSNLYSQESSLNLYNNWSYFAKQQISHIDHRDSKFGYDGLSFGYRRVKENLTFHELELKTGLRFKNDSENNSKRIYNHIRYEIGKQTKAKLFNKFDFQYGLAFKLFHFYEQIDPQALDLFKSVENKVGLSTALITNFEYDISDKFHVQLKVNLINLTFAGGISKTSRPDIPNDQRRNGNMDIDFLGEQSLRFGLGYKFGKKIAGELEALCLEYH